VQLFEITKMLIAVLKINFIVSFIIFFIFIFQRWKWPAWGNGTVPAVSAQCRSRFASETSAVSLATAAALRADR